MHRWRCPCNRCGNGPIARPAQYHRHPRIGSRRMLVIGGTIVLTAAALWQMKLVLAANGLTPLAVFMLALFVALFAWIALSFISAIAGFVSLVSGGGHRLDPGPDQPPIVGPTALLMPTYNENPSPRDGRVAGDP